VPDAGAPTGSGEHQGHDHNHSTDNHDHEGGGDDHRRHHTTHLGGSGIGDYDRKRERLLPQLQRGPSSRGDPQPAWGVRLLLVRRDGDGIACV